MTVPPASSVAAHKPGQQCAVAVEPCRAHADQCSACGRPAQQSHVIVLSPTVRTILFIAVVGILVMALFPVVVMRLAYVTKSVNSLSEQSGLHSALSNSTALLSSVGNSTDVLSAAGGNATASGALLASATALAADLHQQPDAAESASSNKDSAARAARPAAQRAEMRSGYRAARRRRHLHNGPA